MPNYGFDEKQARAFIERELIKSEASTMFYWESEETEEVVDLLVSIFAKLVAANNKKLMSDMERAWAQALR